MKNEFDSLKEVVVADTIKSLLNMFQTECAKFADQVTKDRKIIPDCFVSEVQCEEQVEH